MHFLNGGRMYIKPDQQCRSAEQQLSNCLLQLEQLSLKKRIYKLNFFSGTTSFHDYQRLKEKVEGQVAVRLPAPVLCSLISQPPLTCHILAEVFYTGESLWKRELHLCEKGSVLVFEREGAGILIGQVQVNNAGSCNTSASAAFRSMEKLLDKTGFPLSSVLRQWNYIENILGLESNKQRYQEFNNVRSEFYSNFFDKTGFPAATGIGMNHGGIIIEFVAINAPEARNLPLDNPQQVAAHEYSPVVLTGESHQPQYTPKFERARYLELFGRKQLFISGTASIRGEKTAGIGNPEEQTRITIENIQHLYSDDRIQLLSGNAVKPTYGHARVYLKNRNDFPVVKKTFKTYYGNLPVVYLLADICRKDLLVEIEGKVILEKI